jgi:septum formation protein
LLNFQKKLYLASKSPRRIEILNLMNLKFTLVDSEIDEDITISMRPEELVMHLSREKVKAALNKISDGIILSADTIVVLDNCVLGKPSSPDDAYNMLRKLSGKNHLVFTGFTLFDKLSGSNLTDYESTNVKFIHLDDEMINEYISSGSPLDKAGAYGIQDSFGSVFVEKIDGCYYNVMGFPASKFYRKAKEFIKTFNL